MEYNRAFNFSAGPSMLPLEVIKRVSEDLPNYGKSGESVMEMSHRSKAFMDIIARAEENLRQLLSIPSNYKVLFLQGGATLQFAMVPLNLMGKSKKADYIVNGTWGKKASKEAQKFGDIKIVASSEEDHFSYIPKTQPEDFRKDADYVHITYNETIHGNHFQSPPDTGGIPLVADMSSCILSEEIDVSKFGLIYVGAQKNIGPAGVTIVILREDLLADVSADCPTYLDYRTHISNESMYNTPPCFGIYVAGEVFKKIKEDGGIKPLHNLDIEKANLLYEYIDRSMLYSCPVAKEDRSIMNVVFVTGSEKLDKDFVAKAKERNLHNLNGHRSIGGMRASIYNAMPLEGIEALVEFMKEFEEENI